jgi:hypothetical protein
VLLERSDGGIPPLSPNQSVQEFQERGLVAAGEEGLAGWAQPVREHRSSDTLVLTLVLNQAIGL